MATKTKAKKVKVDPLFPKPSKPVKSTAKFVSLSVTAVIPVQAYGNIQPTITVHAANFNDARALAMSHIEQLYAHYAESRPAFLGKVEVTEKVIGAVVGETPARPAAKEAAAPAKPAAPVAAAPTAQAGTQKPEPVLKAEKALSLAMTEEAAIIVQDQIEKSVKIPTEFKPALLELCLKRRSELAPSL